MEYSLLNSNKHFDFISSIVSLLFLQTFIVFLILFIIYIKKAIFPMNKYQSKIDYSRKYNSKLSTFQISRELHISVKEYCVKNNIKVRKFLEDIILYKINNPLIK